MKKIESLSRYAALLSMSEIGLGSLLHAWQIPVAGHFLSLNQGFILCKSVRQTEVRFAPFQVSIVAAILKSLSPAGKRLTPMLAIAMQGFLFSLGTLILGRGILGCAVGMTLLCLWGFAQPLLIYFLIFGKDIVEIAQYFVSYEHLVGVFLTLVAIKAGLGLVVSYLAVFGSERSHEKYLDRVVGAFRRREASTSHSNSRSNAFKDLLHDLAQPWFLGSLGLMTLFFFLTEPQDVSLTWFLLRPVAVAFVVFYALRFLPLSRWLSGLSRRSQHPVFLMLSKAISSIQQERGKKI